MIKWLHFTNFKCFTDSHRLDIAPLTLLLGPNSSGKSSILKVLLLLAQTVASRDLERAVQVDGPYAAIGPYRDFVFGHDVKRKVTIALELVPQGSFLWFIDSRVPRPITPSQITLQTTLGMGREMEVLALQTQFTVLDKYLGELTVTKTRGSRGASTGLLRYRDRAISFQPPRRAKFYDLTMSPSRLWHPSNRTYREYSTLVRLLSYLFRQFETAFSRISYLGPIRVEPERIYAGVTERPRDVGMAGEEAVHALWFGKREKRQIVLRRKIQDWMREFDIGREVKLRQVHAPYFQLQLSDKQTGVKVTLADVGFGASQLLPVIVSGYYAPSGSLILQEQPEIHLHPKAQTRLADVLIDVTKQGKRLLVETHSEHLLLRIQRRIAEGSISPDDVAIYYCEPSPKGTQLLRIEVDDHGQLAPEGLPEGFFDDSYREVRAHMAAIVQAGKSEHRSQEGTTNDGPMGP